LGNAREYAAKAAPTSVPVYKLIDYFLQADILSLHRTLLAQDLRLETMCSVQLTPSTTLHLLYLFSYIRKKGDKNKQQQGFASGHPSNYYSAGILLK
jgi:hypothetical protein